KAPIECAGDVPGFEAEPEDSAPVKMSAEREPEIEEEPYDEANAHGGRKVPFTNLNKIFWPEEKYTKGDLIEFYRSASEWILPYLKDRPVVLTRYPDGILGKNFFQKDAPSFVPEWMRLERIWSEDTQREISYFVCDNVESLLYIANMASIPLHIWGSRIS